MVKGSLALLSVSKSKQEFLLEIEMDCISALELVHELRDKPEHSLSELSYRLKSWQEKSQKIGLNNLSNYVEKCLELVEKLRAIDTKPESLYKVVYIINKILYELLERLDTLKIRHLSLVGSRGITSGHTSSHLFKAGDNKTKMRHQESGSGEYTYFLFEICQQRYAIRADYIKELIAWGRLIESKLPFADPRFFAVIRYQGNFLPILNIKGLDPKKGHLSLIVCSYHHCMFAIPVDKTKPTSCTQKVVQLEQKEGQIATESFPVTSKLLVDSEDYGLIGPEQINSLVVEQ